MDQSNFTAHNFDEIISLKNLFASWDEFKRHKNRRPDVLAFEHHLEDNIFQLHQDLKSGRYRHGGYSTFRICDPKPRTISKASVRDRVVQHAVFNELDRIFDSRFIYHSYSSRLDKGSHLAVANLAKALRQASRNYYTGNIFVLKCDIKKFFANINHRKSLEIIKRKISDEIFFRLVEEIIGSFFTPADKFPERDRVSGLPLGNVTSQIFANIYLNELDQFIKHRLKAKHYFRYADDFVIVHQNTDYLIDALINIDCFLQFELDLQLHPNKVEIRKFSQGIDFLGYVILPRYAVLRTKTKKRMFKKIRIKKDLLNKGLIEEGSFNQSMQSYLGLLKHCRGQKLEMKLRFI